MNQVVLNLNIFINKIGSESIVSHDATHFCGCHKNVVGPFFGQKFKNGLLVSEVKLFGGSGDNISESFGCQIPLNGRPNHAPMPSDVYFICFFQFYKKYFV